MPNRSHNASITHGVPRAKGMDEFETRGQLGLWGATWLLALCKGIDNVQAAYPGNRAAQPHQLVAIQSVCSAECVNDVSDGLSCNRNRMALIVGQLVVLDEGAVFVSSLGGSQVHDCLHT